MRARPEREVGAALDEEHAAPAVEIGWATATAAHAPAAILGAMPFVELPGDQPAERRGVEERLPGDAPDEAPEREVAHPAQPDRAERHDVGAEHLVGGETAPQRDQVLDTVRAALGRRAEHADVDRPGARPDEEPHVRALTREAADLEQACNTPA